MLWLGKTTKSLFFFSFLDLLHKDRARESITWLSITRVTGLWVTVRWWHMTKSHGNCRKKVHRLYSSCISNVGKLTGTPLSSPCQLRLGVDLSHHSLRPYKLSFFLLSVISDILKSCSIILIKFLSIFVCPFYLDILRLRDVGIWFFTDIFCWLLEL